LDVNCDLTKENATTTGANDTRIVSREALKDLICCPLWAFRWRSFIYRASSKFHWRYSITNKN